MAKSSVKEFLKRRNVNITVWVYLIDALGTIIFDLFVSLLIGTTFGTLDRQLQIEILNVIADHAKSITGVALGTVIAHALKAPQLASFSAATVGITGNALSGLVGVLVATTMAVELGKIVSRGIRPDIIVMLDITIISGVLMAQFVEPGVTQSMSWFGNLVKTTTEMQSFIMGVLASVPISITLTPPISSAAICIALSLGGLAGGAVTAGCCARMIGFIIMSYRENKVGGLMAQGLGTSMLQMGNTVLDFCIWIPPTLVFMVAGLTAIMVFHLESIPAGAGMGTRGLVSLIGVYMVMGGGTRTWVGILLVCFLLPDMLTFVFGEVLRKMGWIKDGGLKLDL